MRRDKDIIGYKYNDDEQKLREQIAKEIEASCDATTYNCICGHCLDAAAIARGIK